jgi:hypothetical protein
VAYQGQRLGASVGLDYLGVANFLSVANGVGLFGSLALPLRFRSFPLVLARFLEQVVDRSSFP